MQAADPTRICWIGLRFPKGEPARTGASRPFERLTEHRTPSLLSLGGVLAWYASQISSILDDPVTGLAGRAEFQASLRLAYDQAKDGSVHLALSSSTRMTSRR